MVGKLMFESGISRLKARRCGVAGTGGIQQWRDQARRRRKRKRGPTGGARMAVTREREGATTGMHKPEEKVPFGECAKASQAEWGGDGLRGGKGRCRRAGLDPGGDFESKLIFEFRMNLDIGKNLRISIRRFRRNLDMRIFPKFF
jgi:hypothetical protein